jgi:hypothetical protein
MDLRDAAQKFAKLIAEFAAMRVSQTASVDKTHWKVSDRCGKRRSLGQSQGRVA